MKTWKSFPRGAHWLWVAVAIVAVVGVADAGAREKKRDRERVHSGYIGVHMQELTDDVRKGLDIKIAEGVLISGVEDDSPAAKAGLEDGDVVVSFNGAKIGEPDDLREAVRGLEPGTEAKMEVVQNGKTKTLTVTVGERPEEQWGLFLGPDAPRAPEFHRAFAMMAGPRLGIQAHELSDELGAYFNAKQGDGVLVLGVDEESVAAGAGVKAGDIVQKIGDEKIAGVEDLRASLRDFEEGDEFTITVLRHGKTQSLKATMDEQTGSEFSWMFDGRGPRAERMHGRQGRMHSFMVPGPHDEDLRKELDELREELEQLKEKMDGSAD